MDRSELCSRWNGIIFFPPLDHCSWTEIRWWWWWSSSSSSPSSPPSCVSTPCCIALYNVVILWLSLLMLLPPWWLVGLWADPWWFYVGCCHFAIVGVPEYFIVIGFALTYQTQNFSFYRAFCWSPVSIPYALHIWVCCLFLLSFAVSILFLTLKMVLASGLVIFFHVAGSLLRPPACYPFQ